MKSKISLLVIPFLIIHLFAYQGKNNFNERRAKMIKTQIETRGVKDAAVLKSMYDVPRHLFVPEQYQNDAYSDGPLPIGHGQTISQPYIVAFMTELLQVKKDHDVLEIGTGSGYQAAILSKLVHHVFTIEIVPELASESRKRLKNLGFDNITIYAGDGYKGWPVERQFDRIIVTAAPEEIPQKLVEQLKPSGIMVLPKGTQIWGQDLLVVEKTKDGKIKTKKTIPVRFVPMVTEYE